MNRTPLTVEVFRGDTVESSHAVHCIIMDRDGEILESWGNMERLISPRSSLKPLQTIPLVESGAIDDFGLGDVEIALASASHNAEAIHIEKVSDWLGKIGLTENDLECGGHLSLNEERSHEMIRNDEKMSGLLSDCSGKHAGMLTTAQHQGNSVKNYVALDHPVQKQIYQTISEMAEYDLSKDHSGTDGCSAPNPAIPLKNLALAFSYFMNSKNLSDTRSKACARILDAMAAYPYLIGGKERFDTVLNEKSKGNIIGKVGAEGNYLTFIRDKGIIIYLKAEDGVFERATLPVLGILLNKLNAIDESIDRAIESFTRPVLKNWKEIEIGKIVVPEFLS